MKRFLDALEDSATLWVWVLIVGAVVVGCYYGITAT